MPIYSEYRTKVVYHLVPTSNHNTLLSLHSMLLLFIILFLHQTTTSINFTVKGFRCLSSCSYIKPQLQLELKNTQFVVYHLVPTSNHNYRMMFPNTRHVVYHLVPTSNHNRKTLPEFYKIVVYHLVPTSNHNLAQTLASLHKVVYHLVPTSNHNSSPTLAYGNLLFIILFLHQTTTSNKTDMFGYGLFIILFLHQTTTYRPYPYPAAVVYHLVPTSNHNYFPNRLVAKGVVYHLVPTSNHNNPTELSMLEKLFIILFLHQTTTYSYKSAGNQQDTSFWASKKWPCRTIPTANILKKF